MNPYKIEGPALISYSGGRTSAYMLRHILDAHGGTLPPDVLVCFADTGKERPETYEFVEETQRRWGFDLHRVMYPGGFEQLIRDRGYLPNPVARICTHHLKVKMMHTWMLGQCEGDWSDVLGLGENDAYVDAGAVRGGLVRRAGSAL
jgi:3'-phosphoadenosine 5'-phosphosulfate sulfotransferase (PAPS reductase)/FAD synthetase